MKLIKSTPAQAVKDNLEYLAQLAATPVAGEALVLFSGNLNVPTLIKSTFIAEWLRNGGRLVLTVGSWSDSIFDVKGAIELLVGTRQTAIGAISFGRDPIQFYCVPQMHVKLAARCKFDVQARTYTVQTAIIGSTNLTKGALQGRNYELDVLFEDNDVAALSELTGYVNAQLNEFESGIGIDAASTKKVQSVFDDWRMAQQFRHAGDRNENLPPDH